MVVCSHGKLALMQCASIGIPEPRWLGVAALRLLHMYVHVRCLVIVKGGTFGPPKLGERSDGHGVHAGEAERGHNAHHLACGGYDRGAVASEAMMRQCSAVPRCYTGVDNRGVVSSSGGSSSVTVAQSSFLLLLLSPLSSLVLVWANCEATSGGRIDRRG